MQADNARKITYGAMMTAFFAILLAVSFYVPLLGTLTMFFIPLPIILYRLKYDQMASLLVLVTGIVISTLIGGIALAPFAFVFGILGFVIGHTIRLEKSRLYTFMASGLTLLTILVMMYMAAVLFFKINFIDELMIGIQSSREEITSLLIKYGELPKDFKAQMDASIDFYETAIPSMFIIGVFSFAFVFVTFNLIAVKRLGHNVQNFPPFREMKLPLITVWYYLIILLAGFIFDIGQGTNMYLIYINASVILRFLFFLQGISLIHHLMYEKKLPKWVAIVSTVFALFLNPITILLGVLDAGLNVRAWIGKEKSK